MSIAPSNAEEDAAYQNAVTNLGLAISTARDSWELAGQAYVALSKRDDWDKHKTTVELIMCMASLDYEIKVLLYRFNTDFENRGIWEKYLGLTLFEGIPAVRKLAGARRQMLVQLEGVTSARAKNQDEAMKAFNGVIKTIQGDSEFWATLTRLRNEVTAHFTGKRESAMLMHADWAATSENSRSRGYHPNMSMIAQYSLRFGRAVQDLGLNEVWKAL